MRTIQTTLGALVFATILFSCKKEVKSTQATAQISNISSKEEAVLAVSPSKWYGIYAEGYGNGIDTIADRDFVANGVATLNNSPWSYYYTSVNLPVRGRRVSCDSLKYVVRLKNPEGQPGSVFPYDVSLYLFGVQNTAYLQFLSYYQEFTALKVGNYGVTNTPNLIYQFQDWTELTLIAKRKKLAVYLNGVLKEQIDYSGRKIGLLQQLEIGFKGSGSVDWVKLYNSYTGAQIMQEDFNGTRSNVIWY